MRVPDMKRFKRSDTGFTLLELIIAIALSAIVLLSAANLLINFGKFSAHVVRSEESLMGTALGSFEEIVWRITSANEVAINPDASLAVPATAYPAGCAATSCIQIRQDAVVPATALIPNDHFTPGEFSDDRVFTYWLVAAAPATVPPSFNLMRSGVIGDGAAGRPIAENIAFLSFARVVPNLVRVIVEGQVTEGPVAGVTREHLETTVNMRQRSAQ